MNTFFKPLAWALPVALMLEISFGLKEEAQLIISTIDRVLKDGYRTSDIADDSTSPYKVLGTQDMGKLVLKFITQQTYTN